MDLRTRLTTWATARAAVLLVEVPGWATTRWAAERELRRRGWRPADSPADADVLLVCGAPGTRLQEACDVVWTQLPGPRARAGSRSPDDVRTALDTALATLVHARRQRDDASTRPAEPVTGSTAAPDHQQQEEGTPSQRCEDGPEDADDEYADDGGADDEDADDARADGSRHGGMDHGGMDHGGMDHGGMDHGDMGMAPGGIPLAGSGGEDRDGLELDVLSVPLGPVLPAWPAGLLLHCTLAGDVVAAARAEVLGPAEDPGARGEPHPAVHGSAADRLDRAAGLLRLAGREAEAATAARLRDAAADRSAGVAEAVAGLLRRTRRSRLTRWALGGTGRLDAEALGLDARLAGTVHDRLLLFLEEAHAAARGQPRHLAPVPVDRLPGLVEGLEIGAVRLLVASLDIDAARAAIPAAAA